jgi:uncharacterized ion transporter superfamily protein YfcC
MNKKILNLIVSLVMLLAFFMPWIKAFGFGGSPYQMIEQVFKNLKYVEKKPEILYSLVLLIFPVCAVIILISYAKNQIKKNQLGILHFTKKAPLIFVIIVILYGLIKLGDGAKMIIEGFTDIVGVGLILTIVSAIVLFFDQPRIQNFSSDSTPVNTSETKEQPNTDDLFN